MAQTDLEARPAPAALTVESIEQASRGRAEPAWLTSQRLAAWQRATELPVPTRTTEGWRRIDLSGLDLTGIDFKRASLTGSRLVESKLIGANLFSCDLTDAVLTGADLSRANLDGTVLRRADFQRANLEGASLFATIIEAADLRGANLSGTRIIGYLRSAKLAGAKLVNANAGADPGNQSMGVMRATFVSADLSGADLSGANDSSRTWPSAMQIVPATPTSPSVSTL